ncbi:unnamed protein product, partial [Ascophyllum nodosum]
MERRLHAAVPTPMTFHSSNDGKRFNLPPAPPSAFNIKLPAGTAAPPAAQVLGDVPACRSPLPQQPGHTAATSFNAFLNGAFAESLGDARNVGGGFGGVGGVGDIIGGGGGGGVRGGGGFVLGEVADAPLRQLIEAKERELHEIHDFRLSRSLEGLLEEREMTLADSFASRYDKLKEDFKFNLGLIEDRDAELGRYEAALQGLQECLRDKEVETSELKMRLDEALSVHRQSAARENEQQGYWQAKCKALRDEMDGLRWAREEESRSAREKAEAARAVLTRELREREDELEHQRTDSAEAFDRIMQQRQEETQTRETEMMTQLREAEARCSDQARRRERAEREAAEFKETSRKLRQSLEEAEKESRGLRWELEDRKKLAAAERDEASKKAEELKEKHEAALCVGEDRLREVLGSLHAVEQAFVQLKERQGLEARALERGEEELRASLEACGLRIQQLEEAVSQGRRREEELRKAVRAAREDHGREATALRKQLAENEARLKVEIDRAEGAAAELRDGNLSLEGVVRALEDKEESLRDDLQAEREERKKVVRQLEQSLGAAREEAVELREQASTARNDAKAAGQELAQSKKQLQDQEEAARAERRDLVRTVEGLQAALAASAAASKSRPNGRASPLFSGDQGTPSPLPPHTGDAVDFDTSAEDGNRAEELLELRAENLRLRGVVADMRREMEALRDPSGMRGNSREREQRLLEENEELRSELSGTRRRLEREGSPALVELEDHLARLKARCADLEGEVERLAAERDKLMDIGNSLRAELNRALSNSFQREGGAPAEARIKDAVSRAQREARLKYQAKYRSRVAEVEAAFAQLAAENRRLKAKGRVGHVSEAVPLSVEGPTSVEEVTAAENEEEEFSTSQQRSRRGSGGDGFDKVKGASPCSSDTRPSPISRRATALPLEDDVQRRQPHRGKGLRCSTSTSNIPDAGPDRRSRDHRPAAERRESDTAAAALTVQPPRRRNRGSPEREDGGVDVYADGRDNPARPLDLNDGIRGGVCGMGDRG